METMICTRLHSMILSVIFRQKFYPIAYSNKIINIIKDLELCRNYSALENITEGEWERIQNNFEEIKTQDEVELLCKAAGQQFEKLDSVLL